jgi:branched-chain amino acid transport system permease protein
VEAVVSSILAGIMTGSMYALVALGMVLVFRSTQTFNFAQGDLMLVPAFFVGRWTADGTFSSGVAILVALVGAAVLGGLMYRLVLQRTTGMSPIIGVIATLGISSMLEGAVAIIFGSNTYTIKLDFMPAGTVTIFGVQVTWSSLTLAAFGFVLAGAVAAAVHLTQLGTQIRAAGQDPLLASQSGIQVRGLYLASWAVAGVLAAVAGIAYASTNLVSPDLATIAIATFPALILGGLDSIGGAILGGLIIGLVQGFTATYLGGNVQNVITYAILMIVLLVRPRGLFGTSAVARL